MIDKEPESSDKKARDKQVITLLSLCTLYDKESEGSDKKARDKQAGNNPPIICVYCMIRSWKAVIRKP